MIRLVVGGWFTGIPDLARSRELNPQLQSRDEWLVRNKDRTPGIAVDEPVA